MLFLWQLALPENLPGDEISVLTNTLASGVGLSKTMHKIAAANELTAGRQDTKIEIIRRTPNW